MPNNLHVVLALEGAFLGGGLPAIGLAALGALAKNAEGVESRINTARSVTPTDRARRSPS